MRNLLSMLMSRLSLFWRYFILLAAVVLVFLVSLIVATGQFSKALQTSYLEQTHSGFRQNCELFARDLFLTHSLLVSLEDLDSYPVVTSAADPLNTSDALGLRDIRNTFATQCTLLDLPAESFLYLERSGVCLTSHRFFGNAADCFDTYIIYNDQFSMMDVLKEGSSSIRPKLLPSCEVSVQGDTPAPHLTLLVFSLRYDVVYGFLYSADTVLEHFQMADMPSGTWLEFTDSAGDTLFSYGDAHGQTDGYAVLSVEMPSLSCTASLGVPQSYFRQVISSAQTTSRLVFLLSVVIGLAMCVLFSHISVVPFRRLLRTHGAEHDHDGDGRENELAAIDSILKSTKEKNVALGSMLLSSLLVRTFSGLPIAEDEYKRISAAFPAFKQPQQAAVVRDRGAGQAAEDDGSLIDLLRNALPRQFMCEYINIQESIVIFPADGACCDMLQRALLELNGGGEREARYVCGVSLPFVGVSEVSASIRQAQFCVPEKGERMFITAAQEGQMEESECHSFDLKPFRQALASWRQHEALGQLDQMAAFVSRGTAHAPEELFYGALFLLRDTAQSGKLSFETHEKLAYQHNGSPASNVRRLKAVVNDLFAQKAAVQLTDKQLLCEEIVRYIKSHFSDTSLCMASISTHFCVSERFVYNAVLDVTGMNASTFLAKTRMHEAARLLRETDESVGAIAEKCGYPVESTFYRNFKKYYKLTPAEYRAAGDQ